MKEARERGVKMRPSIRSITVETTARKAYIGYVKTTDIAVVGAGLAGMATALACVRTGQRVLLIDSGTPGVGSDPRASFLAASTLRMFDRLGIALDAQPVSDILAAEGRPGEPVSPGSLHFAGELGAVSMNTDIAAALTKAVRSSDIDLTENCRVEGLSTSIGGAELSTSTGPVSARLVVAADGRDSALRRRAGIPLKRHDYGQRALTFTMAHSALHNGVAYQIFFPGGPLATLPLRGDRSSVVWTDTPEAIHAAASLTPAALAAELELRLGGTLGHLRIEDTPVSYPLEQRLATELTSDRLALVGDAAHLIHPLAGQGINLGFRDAAALADVVGEAAGLGRDIGGPALADYARWRRGDVRGMALATDALGHAYALKGPLGAARRLATGLIDRSPLASFLSREAAGERSNLPELML